MTNLILANQNSPKHSLGMIWELVWVTDHLEHRLSGHSHPASDGQETLAVSQSLTPVMKQGPLLPVKSVEIHVCTCKEH